MKRLAPILLILFIGLKLMFAYLMTGKHEPIYYVIVDAFSKAIYFGLFGALFYLLPQSLISKVAIVFCFIVAVFHLYVLTPAYDKVVGIALFSTCFVCWIALIIYYLYCLRSKIQP